MSTASYRQPSRYLTLLIVAGVHLLAVVALRVELAVQPRDSASSSADPPALIVSFLELLESTEAEPAPPEPTRSHSLASTAPAERGSSAIQLPAPDSGKTPAKPPEAPIDWQMELKRASQAMLDRAEEQARYDAAFARRGKVPEALRPGAPETQDFAWSYRADRIQDGAIHLNERCILIMGILPACHFGKIPVRSDLFADMRKHKSADELDVPHSRSLESVDRETRIILAAVSRLLGEWRAAHGNYPQDLSELVSAAAPAGAMGEGVLIVDTWSNKLLYEHPARGGACDYELYSSGPNGVDDQGKRDDIVTCGSTPDLAF